MVTAVGDGVTDVAEGDHVVIVAMPQCGHCARCARGQHFLCERGQGILESGGLLDGTSRFETPLGDAVNQMVATGTFVDQVVVPAISVVPIPEDVPFPAASLIGCSVLTGAGAALNAATIERGDVVAVIGCGNVGLSAIQGARLAGADQVVAVDLFGSKLGLALELGATDAVDASERDPVAAVRELTGGRGADVTIEAAGAQSTIDQAVEMTDNGGEVIFVGAGDHSARVDLPQFRGLVARSKTLKGCLFGSAHVRRDVPRLIEHYRAGELSLDRMISWSGPIDQVNEGLAAAASGDVVSAVLEF